MYVCVMLYVCIYVCMYVCCTTLGSVTNRLHVSCLSFQQLVNIYESEFWRQPVWVLET
jgi:hypothetical protein